MTVNVFHREEGDRVRGTASGYWNGSFLQDIVGDMVVFLYGAFASGGNLCRQVETFSYDGFPNPKFYADTSWEVIVEGCGTFLLRKYHTSCSPPILTYTPLDMMPTGTVTWTNFCGCEGSTVPTEAQSWGQIKTLYR